MSKHIKKEVKVTKLQTYWSHIQNNPSSRPVLYFACLVICTVHAVSVTFTDMQTFSKIAFVAVSNTTFPRLSLLNFLFVVNKISAKFYFSSPWCLLDSLTTVVAPYS